MEETERSYRSPIQEKDSSEGMEGRDKRGSGVDVDVDVEDGLELDELERLRELI